MAALFILTHCYGVVRWFRRFLNNTLATELVTCRLINVENLTLVAKSVPEMGLERKTRDVTAKKY